MKLTMIFIIISCLSSCSSYSNAVKYPSPPKDSKPSQELIDKAKSLSTFEGVWEGTLNEIYDPVGNNRYIGKELLIRLAVAGTNVEVYSREDGRWYEIKRGLFRLNQLNTVANISSTESGDSWNEVWSMNMVRNSENTVTVYVFRAVNNIFFDENSPFNTYAVAWSGTLSMMAE